VNEYKAKVVRLSESESRVFIVGEHDDKHSFAFTLYCKRKDDIGKPLYFFFNMDDHKCLVVNPQVNQFYGATYDCKVLRFWLGENDLPVLSARLYENQVEIMSDIESEFQLKHASLILDGIINQD